MDYDEDILSTPSNLFYSGELVACACPSVRNRFCGDSLCSILPAKEHPIIFHGVRGENCVVCFYAGSSPANVHTLVLQLGLATDISRAT